MAFTDKFLGRLASEETRRAPRICHVLEDGSIKAEEVRGGRVVREDKRGERVRKGVWLELAKNPQGKGVLRLRTPSRGNLLLTVPLASVKRVGCPRRAGWWWARFAPSWGADWLRSIPSGQAKVFEVEGMVDGDRLAAAFAVKDPEAWMHAVEAPEWSFKQTMAF